MKQNLEAELQKLKGLYEHELEQMKAEIEELSLQRNKYALENFNLELKLKDFSIKFEDVKRANEELEIELRNTKVNLNRTEFELENTKLEIEKPIRENKQLKKDLEDLLEKFTELQTISDNEVVYRQKLEKMLKEKNDSCAFKDKLSQQELERLKVQLNSVQGDYDELNRKLQNALLREKNLESENSALKNQVTTLKQTCANLENKIQTLEQIRKNLERSSFDSSLSILKAKQQQQLQQMDLNEETTRSMLKINRSSSASIGGGETKPTHSKVSFHSNVFEDSPNEPTKLVSTVDTATTTNKTTSDMPICRKPIQPSAVRFKKSDSLDQPVDSNNASGSNRGGTTNFIVHSSGVSSPLFSSSSMGRQEENNLPEKLTTKTSTTTINDDLNRIKSATTMTSSSRDFTKELFSQLEKKIFSSAASSSATTAAAAGFENRLRKDLNSSLSSIDNQTVTEASYIGNVKIHEVNKNGYYVRLLNTSSKQEEDLSNYSIQQMVSTMPVAVFRLPASVKLCPGKTITVWSSTDEVEQEPPHTFVWNEQKRWGTGPECTTILAKPNGQAVSWTTGCHKYGNIALKDYDDIVSVYTHKRNSKTTAFLERNKFIPQRVYTPTKHPHGMSSMKTNGEVVSGDLTPSSSSNSTAGKGSQQFSTSPLQRNLIHQRPRSSTASSMSMRTTTSLGHYAIRPETTSKESVSYFQKPNSDD